MWFEFPLVYFCAMRSHALLDDLKWRGLLYQNTDEVADALTSGPISGYFGFDPTAPSLHVGNFAGRSCCWCAFSDTGIGRWRWSAAAPG